MKRKGEATQKWMDGPSQTSGSMQIFIFPIGGYRIRRQSLPPWLFSCDFNKTHDPRRLSSWSQQKRFHLNHLHVIIHELVLEIKVMEVISTRIQ